MSKKNNPWPVFVTPAPRGDGWVWQIVVPELIRRNGHVKHLDQVEKAAEEAIEHDVYDKGHAPYAPVALSFPPDLQYRMTTSSPLGALMAVICDIDSTLALHVARGPYELDKCETDALNDPVAMVLGALQAQGHKVILVSGRYDTHRPHTERWLAKNDVKYDALHMRAEGDHRSDDNVKLDIFQNLVVPEYNVWLALDDRDRCVLLWRLLGLVCFQVERGDF